MLAQATEKKAQSQSGEARYRAFYDAEKRCSTADVIDLKTHADGQGMDSARPDEGVRRWDFTASRSTATALTFSCPLQFRCSRAVLSRKTFQATLADWSTDHIPGGEGLI